MITIAASINLNKLGTKRIWIPPHGRPYWVLFGRPNVGPHLTDKRLKRIGLISRIKCPFDKVWEESCRKERIKNKE